MAEPKTKKEKGYEGKIVKRLLACPTLTDDAFKGPVETLFPEIWEIYCKVVTRPMDLGTIKQRVNAGQYAGYPRDGALVHPDFVRDVNQVWANAMTYNKDGAIYYNQALLMKAYFEKQLQKYGDRVSGQAAQTRVPSATPPAIALSLAASKLPPVGEGAAAAAPSTSGGFSFPAKIPKKVKAERSEVEQITGLLERPPGCGSPPAPADTSQNAASPAKFSFVMSGKNKGPALPPGSMGLPPGSMGFPKAAEPAAARSSKSDADTLMRIPSKREREGGGDEIADDACDFKQDMAGGGSKKAKKAKKEKKHKSSKYASPNSGSMSPADGSPKRSALDKERDPWVKVKNKGLWRERVVSRLGAPPAHPPSNSNPLLQSIAPIHCSNPSLQSIAPIHRSNPSLPSIAPIHCSNPLLQPIAPIHCSNPLLQPIAPIHRSHPLLQSIAPIHCSHPLLQSIAPIHCSNPLLQSPNRCA